MYQKMTPVDLQKIRADFPVLAQEVHGRPLVYLDSAATSQKPRAVIDAEAHYYERDNANVHRGVHELSQRATKAYEDARNKVRAFLGAAESRQIIFTRGTTEAINLVAQSFVRPRVGPGHQVLITEMEHHSNIVPWQMVCKATGAELVVVPIQDDGSLDVAAFDEALRPQVRFVSFTHVSNALGTINPVKALIDKAHGIGAQVMVDGAQAAPHLPVDVEELGCDFYAISGHKMYAPTGIGALYGKAGLLEAMPPYQGGGDMISRVSFEGTTYNEIPYKFEAGTPNIAGAIGLGAAIDYLQDIGMENVAEHEHDLLEYATAKMQKIPGLRVIGTASSKAGVISFELKGIHPHDIGSLLDRAGIAVRTGHHCAQPAMDHFGVPATTRASFGVYNNRADVDRLVEALEEVVEVFG